MKKVIHDAPATKRDILNTEKRIVDKIVKKINLVIEYFERDSIGTKARIKKLEDQVFQPFAR